MGRQITGPGRHVFFVLAAFAALMGTIDGTIVAVALPQITTGLDAPLIWASWTLTGYQLVQMIMLPVSGKLSDSFGRKQVFIFSVAVFTLSSLACGLAPNIGFLIVFRALQAVGGGGLVPSATGIIADQYRDRRAQAVGLFTSVFPIGGVIGPNVGGFILLNWTWRELFWINVPIGIVVIAGALYLLAGREANKPRVRLRVDAVGTAQYAGAIVALTYGMTAIADGSVSAANPLVWGLFAFSVVLAVLFFRHIRRTPDPVMDFDLVAKNPFLAANLYNVIFGAAAFGFFNFAPTFAVVRYGLDAFESGAVLTPRALAMIATSMLASVFIIKFGYRLPMIVGPFLVATTLVLLSFDWTSVQIFGQQIQGFWLMAAILTFSGVGMGLANPASSNTVLDLAPRQAAMVTGLSNMFRLTGGIVSITAVSLALTYFKDEATGLATIFGVLAIVTLCSTPMVFMIPDMARQSYLRRRAGLPAITEPVERPVVEMHA